MIATFRGCLSLILSLSLALITPAPLFASGNEPALSAKEAAQLTHDLQLAYFAMLDHEMPEVARLGLEPAEKSWLVAAGDSLLDQDPFFMRAQSWQAAGADQCASGICFRKEQGALILSLEGQSQALSLKQNFTPILETSEHVFLAADDDRIFREKTGTDGEAGQGVFFIAKKDLLFAGQKNAAVPVFFFPLPGEGWTGANEHSFQWSIADKVIFYNQGGFGLPVDGDDIVLMEKAGRQNLMLAATFNFLDGQHDQRGIALPKPNTTLAFGLLLSGLTTKAAAKKNGQASNIDLSVLPKAYAEGETSDRKAIDQEVKERAKTADDEGWGWDYWKKWVLNAVAYGGTGVAAYSLYHPIDFSNMITEDMPERVATVAKIIGAVAVASVAMKYTIHRQHFDKLYPTKPEDGVLRKLNQEHKGIMTEIAYGLYFSLAALPQSIRHTLEFLKDHFVPGNKLISKSWDKTMGWQMRQNSQLPMNYKTQYFGWLFGLSDSIQVAIYVLIFGPAAFNFLNSMGFDISVGQATAAYASSEVLRNFLAYLQSGAHGYSAEVKFIHMKSAENEARNQMRSRGLNPDAARNQPELQRLTEQELDRRYKTVGLPGQDEFLYDPITVIEGLAKYSGYTSAEAKAAFSKSNFVLTNRHWGKVQPALKKALKMANEAQKKNPSATGAQVIKLLEWAAKERSTVKHVAGRVWDAAASKWGADGLRDSIDEEVTKYLANGKTPNYVGSTLAYLKGAFKYLAVDSTKEVRDIREVLYLMSTTGNASEVMKLLPRSWREKAGSDEASATAAELFHRAFFSYYEGDKDLIEPDANLEAQYGGRARAVLDRVGPREPALQDPFVRQIRYWELLHRLKSKDEARRAILNYQPKQFKGMGAKQWNIARAQAQKIWDETKKNEVPEAWRNVAETYTEVSGSEVADVSSWARSYRYRLTVAREFARQVGLDIMDAEESEYVQKVLVQAIAATEGQLNTPSEKIYVSKLTQADRAFYEAQVFQKYFVDTYVSLAVHEHEHLKASSPEYPGRLQKVRKAIAGKPGEVVISAIVRSIESAFRNEETAYRPGLLSWLERNIPVLPDAVHNFIRNLRIMPYFLLISYPIAWYVWQIHQPYALWVFTMLIAFLNPTLVELNNRWQKNNGFKPMGDVPSKLLYGWLHGFLTNPELLLVQAYSEPIVNNFDKYVVKPIKNLPGECADYLTSRAKN